ncbi:MAG: ABC transporter substrate-binding protein [Moraxellaceae bacterium]|nr:ABC transporter substrate-binding protein [Moraxellaceae bacterium]
MKKFLLPLGLVALILSLTSCGPANDTSKASDTSNKTANTSCPEGRLYKHESGETCVADVPKKVVVLEYSFLDHLSVLDEKPVGYAKDSMPAYLDGTVENVTVVGSRKAPSIEKIAELQPDLIIADKKRHSGIYEQLSAIAPTIVHNSLRGDFDDQMDSLKQVANIYKKDEVADKAISNLQEKIATTKQDTKANSVLIDVFRPGRHSVHSEDSVMGSLIGKMGKTNPVKALDGQTQFDIDIERFAKINPDALLFMCTPKSQESMDKFLKNPIISSLKAVKNNNVYFVSKNLWSKGRGVQGVSLILDNADEVGLLKNTPSDKRVCIE